MSVYHSMCEVQLKQGRFNSYTFTVCGGIMASNLWNYIKLIAKFANHFPRIIYSQIESAVFKSFAS